MVLSKPMTAVLLKPIGTGSTRYQPWVSDLQKGQFLHEIHYPVNTRRDINVVSTCFLVATPKTKMQR